MAVRAPPNGKDRDHRQAINPESLVGCQVQRGLTAAQEAMGIVHRMVFVCRRVVLVRRCVMVVLGVRVAVVRSKDMQHVADTSEGRDHRQI